VQSPQLERLEDEHTSLLKEKADMISQRRKRDDEDDLALCFGDLPQLADEQPPTSTRQGRSAARIQRRQQRRRANPSTQTAEEGYSTDSSLPPPESQDFQTALAMLQEKAGHVLGDVRAKEFRDPRIGLGKWFGEWREKYEDIYVGAWGGLGLIGAWEFWARLEIVGWNPFQVC
jgi:GC-rich sequence DNA-binding factor